MKKIILIILVNTLLGQIQYSGYLKTKTVVNNTSNKILNLPYRLSGFNFSYSFAMIDIIANSELEFINKSMKSNFNFRELYLGFYPSFGEVRIGKQINKWGYLETSNPIDNLNPFDLNYIFEDRKYQKIPNFSVLFETFIGDNKLGIIFIPNHKPNRNTITSDFDFIDDLNPVNIENEKKSQWGISFESIFSHHDYMLTYFNGYDFSPSYSGSGQTLPNQKSNNLFYYEYRTTQVLGLSTLSYWENLTLNSELAFFNSRTSLDIPSPANYKSEYIQYVLQIQFPIIYNTIFTSQLIGNKSFIEKGTVYENGALIEVNNKGMKLGLSKLLLSENILSVSFHRKFLNNTINVSYTSLIDLYQLGYMNRIKFEYNFLKKWLITIDNKNFTNKNDSNNNIFSQFEDFSNLIIEIKFSF